MALEKEDNYHEDSDDKFHYDCDNDSFSLREKCLYSELFWSAFSRIRTEYGEILRICPHSVWTHENKNHNNSEHLHFLRSVSDSGLLQFGSSVILMDFAQNPM